MLPFDYLLRKDWPLGSPVCDVFLCFVTFPCGVLCQVWYLIVSSPDRCLLPYFKYVLKVVRDPCQKITLLLL